MTSYVVADYLKDEFISLEDNPRVSVKAWQTPGSKMFIREGTNVKVSDLIKGMIIQSGNDAMSLWQNILQVVKKILFI